MTLNDEQPDCIRDDRDDQDGRDGQPRPGVHAGFPSTHWSLVLHASEKASPQQAAALDWLCRHYWPPVYSFIRQRVRAPEAARDLTQEFFARLLACEWLDGLRAEGGKFRSFLLTCVTRFLANEYERGQARKRGGGIQFVALDAFAEEDRQPFEPIDGRRPEAAFDRRWAEAVLARANARVRAEFAESGQETRFDALKIYLVDDGEAVPYAETATRLGLSLAAVKAAIHRLRQRWGEAVRREIMETVAHPHEVEAELRHLLAALSEPIPA